MIERCLIRGLDSEIISAVDFAAMEDKQVMNLAREPHAVESERTQLQRRLEMLEEGQAAFRRELGGF